MSMKCLLKLNRFYKGPSYTIGRLSINGTYFCDTLEDIDRGLHKMMDLKAIRQAKVYGKTAIPIGTYNVDMERYSPKFGERVWAKPYEGKIPHIQNVPAFEGVLIHPGNTDKDTYGCILVGENKEKGKVVNSQATFHKLMNILSQYEEVEITIC